MPKNPYHKISKKGTSVIHLLNIIEFNVINDLTKKNEKKIKGQSEF